MLGILILATVAASALADNQAIAVLQGSSTVKGTIIFTQTNNGVTVEGEIHGLKEGKHGFHIHSKGDLRDGCTSTGSHFNPYNKTHGAPSDVTRHVGDLGNVEANSAGSAKISITDKIISLTGETGILGRAIVVHEGVDDLGKGGNEGSLTTGNAGGRLACGIIGILSDDFSFGGGPTYATASLLVTITSIVAGLCIRKVLES